MSKDPWQHRSKGMSCTACMWYVDKKRIRPLTEELELGIGRCRRHAPTMNGYPVVFANDWCGDHKLDENALPTDSTSTPIDTGSIS